MSFNATKKRAQDITRHINSRRVSVRSCIQLCLHYSGLNGYHSIVDHYNRTEKLNSDNLSSDSIDRILSELTELRQKSIQLREEFAEYRLGLKKEGRRTVSKSDEAIRKNNWNSIHALWNNFDTE